MSHITQIKTQVKDLRALAAAATELGGTLVLDKTTFTAYRNKNNPCAHAIKIPGVSYEVGVTKESDGSFALAFDPYGWDGAGSHDDGHKLLSKFGDGLKRLVQTYATCKLELEARAKGWMTSRSMLQNGNIRVTVTGV